MLSASDLCKHGLANGPGPIKKFFSVQSKPPLHTRVSCNQMLLSASGKLVLLDNNYCCPECRQPIAKVGSNCCDNVEAIASVNFQSVKTLNKNLDKYETRVSSHSRRGTARNNIQMSQNSATNSKQERSEVYSNKSY